MRRIHTVVLWGGLLFGVATLFSVVNSFFYLLVIPQSNSIRPGIYRRTFPAVPLHQGDMVLFWAPSEIANVLQTWGMHVTRVPMLKPVGAAGGDWVCYGEKAVAVGAERAQVLDQTSQGQTIPQHTPGCEVIPEGYFLPLSTWHPRSYDGRYYGPIAHKQIIAKMRLLIPLPEWLYGAP